MFDGKSIADFLTENVFVVLVICIAAFVATRAFGGKIRDAGVAVAICLIAFFLIGAATHAEDIGGWLYSLVTGS